MAKNFTSLFMNRKHQFERVIQKLQIISSTAGNVKASLHVEEEHINPSGALHTGLLAMLTDKMTALAFLNQIQKIVPIVSTDIHVRVMKAPKIGDKILLDAQLARFEDDVAFGEIVFRDAEGAPVAEGTHTIYVMSGKNIKIDFK